MEIPRETVREKYTPGERGRARVRHRDIEAQIHIGIETQILRDTDIQRGTKT